MLRVHGDRRAVPALVVDGLTKRYGDHNVVDQLSFTVPSAAVTGFIGANGAGKTTTMRMLLSLIRPTAGSARVLGVPLDRPHEYLPRVGAIVESPAFYPQLSGRKNLEVFARLGGFDTDLDSMLALVGLAGAEGRQYRRYSLGMKQRLGIAAALLPRPHLLVLDEPTNGLDPEGIREVRALLKSLTYEGTTVLVSSHLLDELEHICDHVVMIDRGRLVYEGSVRGLTDSTRRLRLVPEFSTDLVRLQAACIERGWSCSLDADALLVEADVVMAADLNRHAAAIGITLQQLTPETARLEDAFFAKLSEPMEEVVR